MRLILPRLAPFYERSSEIAYAVLRVVAGLALVTHGWPKIQNPTGAAGMVEGLGFYPGPLWSVLLSCTEFFGGILLAFGLLTRPAALATSVVLAVTVYFHWIVMDQGYEGAEKSIIWLAVLLLLAAKGAGPHSADRAVGREF